MKVYPKGSDEFISKDFRAREMDCACDHCSQTFIDETLIQMLQNIRDNLDMAMHITSGNRCDYYQAQLKAKGYETAPGRSQHQDAKAADFQTGHHTGEQLEKVARLVGFRAVGIGKNFIHVDLRSDRDRSWTYSY